MADFTPEEIASFKAYEASQAPKEFTEAEIEAFKDYEAKLADQANAAVSAQQSSPVIGGVLGAAIPVATGTTKGILKIAPTAKNVASHMQPKDFIRPNPVSETGFHPGASSNAEFNEQQRLANEMRANLHANPVPGFEVPGNSRIILPTGTQLPKEAAPNRPPIAKVKAGMAAAGEHPATQFGGKVAGGYGMGSNAMEAYNRLAKGDPSMRNKIAGYINAAGSGAGAVGMAIPEKFAKYRLPAVATSGALEWLANQVAEDNKKAAGGLIGHYASGKQVVDLAKKAGEILRPLGERFGYNEAKVAKNYPDIAPPVLKIDPKKGNEYLGKDLSPEALAVQKARKAAQMEIDKGQYTPHFDIGQRSHVDPANYPLSVKTIDVTLPKKADTLATHQAKANSPEAVNRLNSAFESANGSPNAHDFYAMKQLEDEFIKHLGPEEGRAAFKERFANPLAATTGGSDPNANLMTAAYTNFVKNTGKELPDNTYDLPFPVGGRFVATNIDQAKKLNELGEIDPVNNPKRYNFAADFMGHQDRPTIDEQMMALFDPKGKKAPEWYGVNEQTINDLAAQKGVSPVNFQEVAWAGGKGYEGKPMMQEINEMIHRTSRITGQTPEEVLKGFIEGNKPMYSLGATGLGASQLDTPEKKAAGGLTHFR